MTASTRTRRPTLDQCRRAVLSETLKLVTLRSTWWVLGLSFVVSLVVGYLTMHSIAASWSRLGAADRLAVDPVSDSFTGIEFTQLAFAAWGAVWMTAEYGQRTIDTTLAATPRRGLSYAAKLVPLAVVALVVGQVTALGCFVMGRLALRGSPLHMAWSDPGVARSIVSTGLLVAVVTVVGFGLGALVRHTATAVAGVVALLFLSWPVARALESISYVPDRWILVNAADALVATRHVVGPDPARTPSVGYAVIVVLTYVAVSVVIGGWRARRDP